MTSNAWPCINWFFLSIFSLIFICNWKRIQAANVLTMPDSLQDITDFDTLAKPGSNQQYQSDFMNARDIIADDDEEDYSDEEPERSKEMYRRNPYERRSLDFYKLKKQLGEVGSTFLNKLFGSENKKRGHERDVQNAEDNANEKEDIPLKVHLQEDNILQDHNSKAENLHNEHSNVKIAEGDEENPKAINHSNEAESVYDETMASPLKEGNEDEYCEILKNKQKQQEQSHHKEVEILPIKHENEELYEEITKEVEKEKAKALAHQIENVIEKEKEQVLNEELEKELEKEKTKELVHEIEKEIAEEKTAELNNKVHDELEKQKEQELHNIIENEKKEGEAAIKEIEKQKEEEIVKEIEKKIENEKAKEANHEVEKLLEIEKTQGLNNNDQTEINAKENEVLKIDLYKCSPKTGDIKKEQTILLNVNPKQSKAKKALDSLQSKDYVIQLLPGNDKLTQIPTGKFAVLPEYNRKRRKRSNNIKLFRVHKYRRQSLEENG